MDSLRAKDILRHITRDEDFGVAAMRSMTVADVIDIYTELLPYCIDKAKADGNTNDVGYFEKISEYAFGVAVEKLKSAERRWVVYDENTGYPYVVGDTMLILYDFNGRSAILDPIIKAGYRVSLAAEDKDGFVSEVAHMYRNGYKYIRFLSGKGEGFLVSREDLFAYEQFFDDSYVTNPGLSMAMIRNIQETKRAGVHDKDLEFLTKLRYELNVQYQNAEYMVPCAKIETEEEITFAHPPIDISNEFPNSEEPVIAIPAFTDGFEMDKCFVGERENMLYNLTQMRDLVDELGVSGFVINFLGQKCYLDRENIKILCDEM